MKFASTMRKATALAVSAAAMFAVAGCGNSNSANGGTDTTTTVTAEPQEGVPVNYEGSFPKPETDKAYNNPKDRDELQQGGTLTLGTVEIGPDWNALSANGNTTYMDGMWRLYMPRIWEYSVDGSTIEPNQNYVTSVEQTSDSPETIVFNINEKATWNDGTPMTWKDFESTWKAMNGTDENFTPAITAGYEDIESVTAGDSDKQVVVTFKKDFYPYESLFNTLYPSKAFEGGADVFAQGWQNDPHSDDWGAGPFKVESSSDSEVTFVPNEKWWGDAPLLDKIVIKQMEDSAALNAFKNGETDASGASSAESMTNAKSREDAYFRRGYDSGVSTLTINTKSVSDLALRKAFVQAIDRSQLQKIDFQGTDWEEDVPGSLILPQFQDGYEDNMPKDSAYSTDNAKKTLEDAGYTLNGDYYEKDGETASITYTTFGDSATSKAITGAIQKMAKAAGIKVDSDVKASADFSKTVYSGDWDMIGLGWGASDPFGYSSSSYQLYGSTSDSNFSFTGTDEIDELLKGVTSIKDSKEAIAQFNEAEKKAQELYAQIPWANGQITIAVKKGLANYGPAGYSAGSRLYFTAHPENVGWEK